MANPSSRQPVNFSPACPTPFVIDPQTRIQHLKSLLLEDRWKRQRKNILKLIQMYETGELGPLTTSTAVWIRNGEVMDHEPGLDDISKDSIVWEETRHSDDAAITGDRFSNGKLDIVWEISRINDAPIYANIRLVPQYGGNPNLSTPVIIANDTGSDVQVIFVSDLANLHYNQNTYAGDLGQLAINTAGGPVVRDHTLIQLQLVDSNGTAITGWFLEKAAVVPNNLGLPRLSGLAMRNHLYFATAPGNAVLYVAEKKNGIVRQLPTV